MNSFVEVALLLTANLMLVASFQNRTIFRKPSDIFENVGLLPLPAVNLTLPGTKWCGIGHTAANYSDLGLFNMTDMCCRAHQQCEDVIEPIGSLHSLYNPTLLPRYNCECEQELLKCLKDLDDFPSALFGEAYFSLMEQCFAEDYPVVECVKYQTGPLGIGKRCTTYKFDETKNKTYQYFDMPFYSVNLD